MKNKLNKRFFCLLLLVTVALFPAIGSAQCWLEISPTNNSIQVNISAPWGVTQDFSAANNSATFSDIVVSGVPGVPSGTYRGWCVDVVDDIGINPANYNALVFSTCDLSLDSLIPAGYPASVYVSPETWQKVNYLLNHKNGAYFWNIQLALWNFVGGPLTTPAGPPAYPPTDQNEVDQLIADANANAATWQPQCGDVLAVVVAVTGTSPLTQLTIIEVPYPCTPCIGVVKEIACLQPNNDCGVFGKIAYGYKGQQDPAFCYHVAITNCGTITLTNVVVWDSMLGDITPNFFTSADRSLTPGQVLHSYYKMAVDGTTNNSVTVQGQTVTDGTQISAVDSAMAVVDSASISCELSIVSCCDLDGSTNDNHVLLPNKGVPCTVQFRIKVTNPGAADLTGVKLSSPVLTSLGAHLPAPFDLPAGTFVSLQYSSPICCSNNPGTVTLNLSGTVKSDALHCGYDITSTNLVGVKSWCSGTIECQPPPPQCLASGDAATIGFWHNKNGQALILSLNGGPNSTTLGNWLASNFPYIFGAHAGANNLTGKSNTKVAALFMQFFSVTGQKTSAQIMAGALAVYVTDSDLAGTAAAKYGFNISTLGTGGKAYNVGPYGTAIGLSNNTSYTVMVLLQQVNAALADGTFNAKANAFNSIFDGINQKGDIN